MTKSKPISLHQRFLQAIPLWVSNESLNFKIWESLFPNKSDEKLLCEVLGEKTVVLAFGDRFLFTSPNRHEIRIFIDLLKKMLPNSNAPTIRDIMPTQLREIVSKWYKSHREDSQITL